MLTMTDSAAEAIKGVLAAQGEDVAADGGLRISTSPMGDAFDLSVATAPAEGDTTVTASGARVFLEPQAANFLDDKVLDAEAAETGEVQFSLAMQGE